MRGGTSSKNVWNLFFFFVESWTLNILSYHIGSCSVHIYIVYATTSGHGKAVWLSCLNVIIPYLILYSYWEIQYPKHINQSLKVQKHLHTRRCPMALSPVLVRVCCNKIFFPVVTHFLLCCSHVSPHVKHACTHNNDQMAPMKYQSWSFVSTIDALPSDITADSFTYSTHTQRKKTQMHSITMDYFTKILFTILTAMDVWEKI